MPQLQIGARHIARVETKYIIGTAGEEQKMSCDAAFPADPNEFQNDLIWQEDVASKFRPQEGLLGTAAGLMPEVVYRTAGTLAFSIPIEAWKVRNPNIEDQTTDAVINPQMRRLETARIKARIRREISSVTVLRDNTVLTQGVTLGAGERFDDVNSPNSDPIAVFQLGAEQVMRNTYGKKVTDILMTPPVMRKLTQNLKVQSYAVGRLNLAKDRPIDGEILEALIGPDLVEKGSIKVVDFVFNNTPEAPRATSAFDNAYPLGPDVAMFAKAKPGGEGGLNYGFGLGKYLAIAENEFLAEGEPIQVVGGNEGIMVYEFPDYDIPGGGYQLQVLQAWKPLVINANAGFLIKNAVDATNTAQYQNSLLFTP